MFHNAAFTASVAPIFDNRGNEIPGDIARGVYRDDGTLISTCGPNFKPVQHMDILEPLVEHFQSNGYEVQERVPDRHSLEDLRGQKGAFVSSYIADGGAKMRAEIILGDFIDPTGSSSFLKQGADTNFFRVTVLNSHDGSWAVRANTSYLRLVCLNGMTQPHFTAGTYGKHTNGFSLGAMKAKIRKALEGMSEDEARFAAMASTKIDVLSAQNLLQRTIAKLPNKPDGTTHFSERMVNNILGRFQREDQTVWGLYNALTEWQTHEPRKSNASALTTRMAREQRVAATLRTDEWQALVAA